MKTPTGILKTELIGAAKGFLENMVVVDDNIRLQPMTSAPKPGDQQPVVIESPGYSLKRGSLTNGDDAGKPSEGKEDIGDDIDLHALLRGACAQHLICSLLDPLAFSKEDAVQALTPVLKKADICVLDWRIQGFEPGELALALLGGLIEPEAPTRHRVFCIYSHFDQPEAAFQQLRDKVGAQFKREGDRFVLKHRNVVVMWLAKENLQGSVNALEHVGEEGLAARLVEVFALLRPGLIPLFALKALAAVRSQTLGILGRYSQEGDRGFVAEMVLQSEATTSDGQLAEAIGDDLSVLVRSVFDGEWLAPGVLREWLTVTEVKPSEDVRAMLNEGTDSEPEEVLDKVATIIRSLGTDEAKRDAVGNLLTSTGDKSLKAFAELLCCEIHLGIQAPHLRPGALVKQGDKYFVCVQPLCDSYIRGTKSHQRRFPFVPLTDQQTEPHVAFRDGSNSKVQFVHPKLYDLTYHVMKKNKSDRVEAVNGKFLAEPAAEKVPGISLDHISMLRVPHTQRILSLLGFDAGRVGLSESEFYRKKARPDKRP